MKNNLKELLKENNQLEKDLYSENNIILTNIILYIKHKKISEIDIELIRKDLIGMALEGQIRGESFSKVIGEDYKELANSLISSCSKESPIKHFLDYTTVFLGGLTILFMAEFIPYIIKYSTFIIPLSVKFITTIGLTIIFALLVYKFICKTAFESHKSVFYRVVTILCIYIIIQVLLQKFLGNVLLLNINSLFILTPLIILLIITSIISAAFTNNLLKNKQYVK